MIVLLDMVLTLVLFKFRFRSWVLLILFPNGNVRVFPVSSLSRSSPSLVDCAGAQLTRDSLRGRRREYEVIRFTETLCHHFDRRQRAPDSIHLRFTRAIDQSHPPDSRPDVESPE